MTFLLKKSSARPEIECFLMEESFDDHVAPLRPLPTTPIFLPE